MVRWYVDEGIATLTAEWKAVHPRATVYHIADSNHSQDPDKSQHAPDDGGKLPGDDKGEVDAADFMPGNRVTEDDLDDLFFGLHESRDPRILYVIRRDMIFSSVVEPWKIRPYKGKYHHHTHVSANDLYDKNTTDWKWEKNMPRTIEYVGVPNAKLPILKYGDEDAVQDGWNHVGRLQHLLNFQEAANPLDIDGVYGANTATKLKRLFGGTGKSTDLSIMRKLYGI